VHNNMKAAHALDMYKSLATASGKVR